MTPIPKGGTPSDRTVRSRMRASASQEPRASPPLRTAELIRPQRSLIYLHDERVRIVGDGARRARCRGGEGWVRRGSLRLDAFFYYCCCCVKYTFPCSSVAVSVFRQKFVLLTDVEKVCAPYAYSTTFFSHESLCVHAECFLRRLISESLGFPSKVES